MVHTAILFQGFFIGASLIMAIGAQNAFVLKQGLKGQHLLLTALTCCICDGILIVLGVMGVGLLMNNHSNWLIALRWLGAAFLSVYGILSFIKAIKPESLVTELNHRQNISKTTTLIMLLSFTLLNPHTYIDTFVLLGSIGAQHCGLDKYLFIIGTLSASIFWFFGLTYGATRLTPLFQKPRAWQVLNSGIGIMMLVIAYKLVF